MVQPPGDIVELLTGHGQRHLLSGWNRLSETERVNLIRQISRIDFPTLSTLYANRDKSSAALPSRWRIAPIPIQSEASGLEQRQQGEAALRQGHVAALLVAGGQGSRLGFEKPKGMYPIGPVTNASLFQIHAEKVLAISKRHGSTVPLLIMTSPATHADTEAYFRSENFFGLSPRDVFFFQQGTMPAVDLATGRLLLEQPGRIFLSPNGHGGTITALAETGMLNELESRGVKHVFYFQVDNPLVKICAPGFLGSHISTRSAASSKVVFKEQPGEKVGVLAIVDGRCAIVEYSDMPAEMAAEREENGALRFRAGSPAIHIFDVDFLRWVTGGGKLAYHTARKKVSYFDTDSGTVKNPTSENAMKFELFIFDALPLAERWLAMETSRAEEFAPLKNATGPDSPETVRLAISRQHGKWLKDAGVSIPCSPTGEPVHPVEISPLFALDEEECLTKVSAELAVNGPTYLR
jgi:UDP-N-acetylglucosamine/UDP-N-acetylgalactosamine diphosphorylase